MLVLSFAGTFHITCSSLTNTYSESEVLASEDPDSRDDAVIVATMKKNAGEAILSEFVQTLEHAWKEKD